MKISVRKMVLMAALGFATLLIAQTADNPMAPYVPKNMKPYYLSMLLLSKPIPPAEHQQDIVKHLAYIREQAEAGKFVLVGPVTEENRLRGIAIIQAGSADEAQKIASGDPLVQAGYFTVEVHPIMLEDLSSVQFEYPAK
jgi:uncharacterized protein YciI